MMTDKENEMATEKLVSVQVNGKACEAAVPACRTLLEMLRELGHAEVKCGCKRATAVPVQYCLTARLWTAA